MQWRKVGARAPEMGRSRSDPELGRSRSDVPRGLPTLRWVQSSVQHPAFSTANLNLQPSHSATHVSFAQRNPQSETITAIFNLQFSQAIRSKTVSEAQSLHKSISKNPQEKLDGFTTRRKLDTMLSNNQSKVVNGIRTVSAALHKALSSKDLPNAQRSHLQTALFDFNRHTQACARALKDDWSRRNRSEILLHKLKMFAGDVQSWFAKSGVKIHKRQHWDYQVTLKDVEAAADKIPNLSDKIQNLSDPVLGRVIGVDERSRRAIFHSMDDNEISMPDFVFEASGEESQLLQHSAAFAFASAGDAKVEAASAGKRSNSSIRSSFVEQLRPDKSDFSLYKSSFEAGPMSSSFFQYSGDKNGVCQCYAGSTGVNCELDLTTAKSSGGHWIWVAAGASVLVVVFVILAVCMWVRRRKKDAAAQPVNFPQIEEAHHRRNRQSWFAAA